MVHTYVTASRKSKHVGGCSPRRKCVMVSSIRFNYCTLPPGTAPTHMLAIARSGHKCISMFIMTRCDSLGTWSWWSFRLKLITINDGCSVLKVFFNLRRQICCISCVGQMIMDLTTLPRNLVQALKILSTKDSEMLKRKAKKFSSYPFFNPN